MKIIRDYLRSVSIPIWSSLFFFIPFLVFLISARSNASDIFKNIIFHIMIYSWSLMYLPLLFRSEINIGRWKLSGKLVPILGIIYLLGTITVFTIGVFFNILQ